MRRYRYLAWFFLLLAALACNLPQEGVGEVQETTPTEAVEMPSAPSPTLEPEPSREGFSTPPLDIALMQEITIPPMGWEGIGCEAATGPGMALVDQFYDQRMLCLYDFPTTLGSQPITIELTGPANEVFTETLNLVEQEGRVRVIGASSGESIGYISNEPPAIGIGLTFVAGMPEGTWVVRAANADGSIEVSDSVQLTHQTSLVSVLPAPLPHNPLTPIPIINLRDDGIVTIIGVRFTPGKEVFVGLYTEISAESSTFAPAYGTTVVVDSSGVFVTEFAVTLGIPEGIYSVAYGESLDSMIIHPLVRRIEVNR